MWLLIVNIAVDTYLRETQDPESRLLVVTNVFYWQFL